MSEPNRTPEQIARDRIDQMLAEAGWSVQDKNQIDFGSAKGLPDRQTGIAVREYPTDSGPADYVLFVERKPSVSFKDLLMSVLLGADDEETLTSLANRLARLNQQLDEREHKQIKDAAGKPLPQITRELLDAVDPDRIIDETNEVLSA